MNCPLLSLTWVIYLSIYFFISSSTRYMCLPVLYNMWTVQFSNHLDCPGRFHFSTSPGLSSYLVSGLSSSSTWIDQISIVQTSAWNCPLYSPQRYLAWVPSPQEAEQELHDPHLLQEGQSPSLQVSPSCTVQYSTVQYTLSQVSPS